LSALLEFAEPGRVEIKPQENAPPRRRMYTTSDHRPREPSDRSRLQDVLL